MLPAAAMVVSVTVRLAAFVILLASIAVGGCRIPVGVADRPGMRQRCADGICVEVLSFLSHRPTVGVWIEAPPATRLINAHLLADAEAPCQGHMPVEWVTIDQNTHRKGPADISGAHGVVLGFPSNSWSAHSGYWRAMFLDVELDVAGRPRCVRTRLTTADGKAAVGL
jgi:hypothetical protein